MTHVNHEQVAKFAEFLPTLESIEPFDFCTGQEGILFPHSNSPGTIEAFFFIAAHQFGFWDMDGNKYNRPMVATAGGVRRKGSDFMFYCMQRALNRDPDFFVPERLELMKEKHADKFFNDDNRRNPLPMWQEHKQMFYDYAYWFVDNGTSPLVMVSKANRARKPLQYFLDSLREVPGYCEDPLQKKAMLLAMILENRPEKFLKVTDPESAVPIIDYHLQRSALRTGLVEIDDAKLLQKNLNRMIVTRDEEELIRKSVYNAIDQLVKKSGLSVGAIDYFFFRNRTRCPETTQPKCEECPVRAICKKETGLFQPVYRTTFY